MTEDEAIKEFQNNIDLPFGVNVSDEASKMAIKALEKQEKIKELLDNCTAFPDDMCDCLVEIEKVINEQ